MLGPAHPFTVALMLYSKVTGPDVVFVTELVKILVGGAIDPEFPELTPLGSGVIKFQV